MQHVWCRILCAVIVIAFSTEAISKTDFKDSSKDKDFSLKSLLNEITTLRSNNQSRELSIVLRHSTVETWSSTYRRSLLHPHYTVNNSKSKNLQYYILTNYRTDFSSSKILCL